MMTAEILETNSEITGYSRRIIASDFTQKKKIQRASSMHKFYIPNVSLSENIVINI